MVPPEWYAGDMAAIEQLLEQLLRRRGRVRELIAAFRDSNREPFPLWDKKRASPCRRSLRRARRGKFVM